MSARTARLSGWVELLMRSITSPRPGHRPSRRAWRRAPAWHWAPPRVATKVEYVPLFPALKSGDCAHLNLYTLSKGSESLCYRGRVMHGLPFPPGGDG